MHYFEQSLVCIIQDVKD